MNRFKKQAPRIFWVVLFSVYVFFHFYHLREWIVFGADQVDNAWAAVRILIEHRYPLVGMVAKNSSGIYIGPAYYYLVAFFYWITHFNPIASPLLAGFTSILTFLALYSITKKIFNQHVALWSIFIYTFSLNIIFADRVQWPVNFIPIISLTIFYMLYKILQGNIQYIIWLSLLVGISFHVHFTSIFYPIIILCTLPLFPRKKATFAYIGISLAIIGILLIPNFIFAIQRHQSTTITTYAETVVQGFHARRFLQIIHDAFIQFELILPWQIIRPFTFLFPIIFSAIVFAKEKKTTWIILSYLTFLWFIIPWVVFTLFKGEISNYYFDINRCIAIFILAYITHILWQSHQAIIRIALITLWGAYAIFTLQKYFIPHTNSLPPSMIDFVEHAKQKGDVINYEDGKPIPFLYYIWLRNHNTY